MGFSWDCVVVKGSLILIFGSGLCSVNTSGFGRGFLGIEGGGEDEDEDEAGKVDFWVRGGAFGGGTKGGGSLKSFWISLGTIGLKSLEDRSVKDFSLPQCGQGIFKT